MFSGFLCILMIGSQWCGRMLVVRNVLQQMRQRQAQGHDLCHQNGKWLMPEIGHRTTRNVLVTWFQSVHRRFSHQSMGKTFIDFPMKVQPASRDEKIKTAIKEAST